MLKQPFYISVLGGILLWFLFFFITPAKVTNELDTSTILFIVASYLSLIAGYFFTDFKFNPIKKSQRTKSLGFIFLLIIVAFLIRYIDLFLVRKLTFSNSILENRILAGEPPQNLIFIFASVFSSLYFVPLLLGLLNKNKNRVYLLVAIVCFLLPFPEAILRGTRKPFLYSFLFLILILVYTKRIKFNKKTLLLIFSSCIILFIVATNILMKREGPKNKDAYHHLIENAIYNDLFKPKQKIIDYVNNNKVSNSKKAIIISAMQIGQYYAHGVFEFDHVIKHYKKNNFEKQYGKYTFQVLPKFTNRLNLSNYNLNKIYLASPRGYTFISFFGGMYIDFGWFALIFMFILGVIQKAIYQKIKQNYFIFAPLFLFLLFTNFFMLTFNFFRGTGTYTLISCIIFVILSSYLMRLKETKPELHEKGIST